MQIHPAGVLNIGKTFSVFRVGLFCTESFDYSRLSTFLEQNGIRMEDVERFTIAKGVFRASTVSGDREWPIAELSSTAAKSCQYCRDFTCRDSDLSCGSVGSDEGWTTLLVRTEHAERIIEEAVGVGVIRAEQLTDKEIRQVENLARLKMMRIYSLEHKD